jgi:peptidoglycan/LPS O-acetylase OafA/YrhL
MIRTSVPAPTTAATTTSRSRTGAPFRVVDLDGIRALAVAAVVLYHLAPGALIGGYLGVDVFFVVSGFLITALLLRERAATGRIALGEFWRRRARRLLPALAVLIPVCCAAAFVIGGDVLVGLGTQALGALTFSSNWLFLADGASYFDETAPELFRNLWSLAVEEQFYLIWPVLMVLLVVRLSRGARGILIGSIAAASAIAMALLVDPADSTRVYYGTDTHAFGLALGALLAVASHGGEPIGEAWSRRRRIAVELGGLVSIAGILALSILMSADSALVFRGGLVVVALLTAAAIAALLVPGGRLGRVLDAAPVRWVGVRSYGIYLWHWPVFALVVSAVPDWPREGGGAWVLGGIALAITVLAAAFSYRWVEQPIRRHGFRTALREFLAVAPRTSAAAAAIVALLVAGSATGLGIAAVVTDPGRSEAQQYIEAGEAAIADPGPEPPLTEQGTVTEPPPPELAGGSEITAVGDSVMLAAAPGMQSQFPGIVIDAEVSRSMGRAPSILQAMRDAGTLRHVVILALGTNGPVSRETLEQVLAILGPDRLLVVVNAQAPRGWIPGVNQTLAEFARYYRNVELANWHEAIQPRLDELARDQVHFGPTGATIFVGTVRDALQRLAELPPLRDESADLSLPRPF